MTSANAAYWIMVQGDLGCKECKKWQGDKRNPPCEQVHNIDSTEEELMCPFREAK